ncbi:hypothetical protein HW35_16150 [Bacillus sp. X1(2014)]|nr:hypothetical protein HW35_16150 [Bacillus sp. X1(2014)]
MMKKKLHPSVLEFKEFVKNNPKIIQEVRKGKATWQELYEDWYLLGEDDKRWEMIGANDEGESNEDTDSKGDFVSNILGLIKKMDPNQLQYYLNNVSQALEAVQGLISQFQAGHSPQGSQVKQQQGPKNPFTFRQD